MTDSFYELAIDDGYGEEPPVTEDSARQTVWPWPTGTTVRDVLNVLPTDMQPVDVEIGMANIMVGEMYRNGKDDDHVAVKFTVAELNGTQAMHFRGEIKRSQVQNVLDLFRDNVVNFHCGSYPLRVVDDGQA